MFSYCSVYYTVYYLYIIILIHINIKSGAQNYDICVGVQMTNYASRVLTNQSTLSNAINMF